MRLAALSMLVLLCLGTSACRRESPVAVAPAVTWLAQAFVALASEGGALRTALDALGWTIASFGRPGVDFFLQSYDGSIEPIFIKTPDHGAIPEDDRAEVAA